MKPWNQESLDKLLEIQDLDIQIRTLHKTVEALQRRCMQEDPQLNNLKMELAEVTESIASTTAQRDMYQNTLDDIRAAIASLTANRNRTVRPRNRSSTEALKNEEEKLKDLIAETTEQIAMLQRNADHIQERIDHRAEQVRKEQEAPEAAIKQHLNEINALETKREASVQGIPSILLRRYDRLRRSRSGVALTILRDGVCKECRMELPTGVMGRLVLGERIDTCPACGRMVARIEHSVDYQALAKKKREKEEKRWEKIRAQREAQSSLLAAEEDTSRATGAPSAAKPKSASSAQAKAAGDETPKTERKKRTSTARTAAGKKPTDEKTTAKKTTAKKTAAKKTSAKKTAAKKTATKKAAAKKTSAKKTAVKKTAVKKTSAKKTAAKKTADDAS